MDRGAILTWCFTNRPRLEPEFRRIRRRLLAQITTFLYRAPRNIANNDFFIPAAQRRQQ